MNIEPTKPTDIPRLQHVLDKTELFPSEMLPEMVAGFFSADGPSDIWLTQLDDGIANGFCFAEPEDLTDGTWNMRAIAVDPTHQGAGRGAALVAACEKAVRAQGGRILIVDTSGSDDFAQTRAFYLKNGYEKEATIRDYWSAGDDKVIFRKSLI